MISPASQDKEEGKGVGKKKIRRGREGGAEDEEEKVEEEGDTETLIRANVCAQ